MIKSVVREHHFSPSVIDKMYLDDQDHHGLEYWYIDVKEVGEKLKEKPHTN